MAVQKLSSKNQIVIPKEARQAMDAKAQTVCKDHTGAS